MDIFTRFKRRGKPELSLKLVALSLVIALILSGSAVITMNVLGVPEVVGGGGLGIAGSTAALASLFVTSPIWGPALGLGGALTVITGGCMLLYQAIKDD